MPPASNKKFRAILKSYPTLSGVVEHLDGYLQARYPDFFGPSASHPVMALKASKVIHDNLWGTNSFWWHELALVDCPIFQRLRDIHQVGLAFQVYPSAQHTRFEHSLGVVTTASRIFDALLDRHSGEIRDIARAIAPQTEPEQTVAQLRQELRLAALLHDTGHSAYSHSSERVYEKLDVLRAASEELSRFVGKQKGAGEVLSFCLASTNAVSELLARAKGRVSDNPAATADNEIDLTNVALLLVGRSRHPYLQFMGDIISSGFDADKLDYLLRDAAAAGLPLRYDLDRYLYSVQLMRETLADPDGELERLYQSATGADVKAYQPAGPSKYPYFEAYRLRLPTRAMNTIEQIVICKLMLFSYVYHHPKVRAAEGMLERVLNGMIRTWRESGSTEEDILDRFLDMTDSTLRSIRYEINPTSDSYLYRLQNRLLPREVYGLGGDVATHAERPLLTDFLTSLQDKEARAGLVADIERAIGEELLIIDSALGPAPQDALLSAGVWLDVPKTPRFEDVEELVVRDTPNVSGVPLLDVFPIGEWTEAYAHYRYRVRIFAFSEYCAKVELAAKRAMQRIIKIEGDSFYQRVKRVRA